MANNDSFYGEGAKSGGGSAPTMLSRSVLGGKGVKPGDRITLRVTRVYDDEVGVEVAGGRDDGEEPADTPEPPTPDTAETEPTPPEPPAPEPATEGSFYS